MKKDFCLTGFRLSHSSKYNLFAKNIVLTKSQKIYIYIPVKDLTVYLFKRNLKPKGLVIWEDSSYLTETGSFDKILIS